LPNSFEKTAANAALVNAWNTSNTQGKSEVQGTARLQIKAIATLVQSSSLKSIARKL